MPFSFWLMLIVGLLTFIPIIIDHGKSVSAMRDAQGREKIIATVRLCLLWGLPALALLATLSRGLESHSSKRQLADATSRIADLETKTRNRTVTPQLRDAVIKAVRNVPSGDIVVAAFQSDQEAVQFGRQIGTLLTEAGLSSRFDATVAMNTTKTGIGFCVNDYDHPPEFALRIYSAFRDASVDISGWWYDKGFASNHLAIYVFSRPIN